MMDFYHVGHPLQFRPVYEAVLISVKHSEGFPGKQNENMLLLTQAGQARLLTTSKKILLLLLQSRYGDIEDNKNISKSGTQIASRCK